MCNNIVSTNVSNQAVGGKLLLCHLTWSSEATIKMKPVYRDWLVSWVSEAQTRQGITLGKMDIFVCC